MSRQTKFCKIMSLQWAMVWMLLPTACGHLTFAVPIDLLTGQIDAITKKRRYDQCENIRDFVAGERLWMFFELVIAVAFWGWNCWLHGFSNGVSLEGLGAVFLPYTVASFVFMVFTQGAHITESSQVDIADTQDKSWAKRQAVTAVVFKPESYIWAFVSGSLNMQALHHILPGVSASHYRDLYPRFQRVCKKHGVEVTEVPGISAFFCGFLNWINDLSLDLVELEGLDAAKKTS